MFGIGYFGRRIAVFKSFGSKQILSLLFRRTATMLLIQSVGSSTRGIIFAATNSSSFFFKSAFKATATFLGPCWTGRTSGSISMWYFPGNLPNPSNTSGKLSKIFSIVSTLHVSSMFNVRSPHFKHVSADSKGVKFCSKTWKFSSQLFSLYWHCNFTSPFGVISDPSYVFNLAPLSLR